MKRIDSRVSRLVESGAAAHQRSLLVVVGDGAERRVPSLYALLKRVVLERLKVLWCYETKLEVSSSRVKRTRVLERLRRSGQLDEEELTVTAEFFATADITYLHYRDSARALGTTVHMLIYQDFTSLTPNVLGQTLECVKGGGLVVFLLNNLHSLDELHSAAMRYHSKFANLHSRVTTPDAIANRFVGRFVKLLAYLPRCLVIDDSFTVLPLTQKIKDLMSSLELTDEGREDRDKRFREFRKHHERTTSALHSAFISRCATLDQARLVVQFFELLDNLAHARATKNARSEIGDETARAKEQHITNTESGSEPKRKRMIRPDDVITKEDVPESSHDSSSDTNEEGPVGVDAGADFLRSCTVQASTIPICSLIASRGRGKSAALGLLIAILFTREYNNILISAPNPSNIQTVFEFCVIGLQLLEYREGIDYVVERLGTRATDPIVKVQTRRAVKQMAAYISPHALADFCSEVDKSTSAIVSFVDAIIIDECAAIPLEVVRRIVEHIEASVLCIISSTCHGYEASGRALSLKLLHSLERNGAARGQPLVKLTLGEPIRYSQDDCLERWGNQLLCLDPTRTLLSPVKEGVDDAEVAPVFPKPETCTLYRVSKDALFSGLPQTELFLQAIWGIFSASHYKNSPNDLILLADNPLHDVFVLCPPITDTSRLPPILCACQVASEGFLRTSVVRDALQHQQRHEGDMISWIVAQHYQQPSFAELGGARIVRIATSASYMRGGYGSYVLSQLGRFYRGELYNAIEVGRIDERLRARAIQEAEATGKSVEEALAALKGRVPALLQKLSVVKPPPIAWLGVGFGVTLDLLQFWRRNKFSPVYIRQDVNPTTGEHTVLMLRGINEGEARLERFTEAFRRRLMHLLRYNLSRLPLEVAFRLIWPENTVTLKEVTDVGAVKALLEPEDVGRIKAFVGHQLDFLAIRDLVPPLAELVFSRRVGPLSLGHVAARLLLGIGLMGREQKALLQELSLVSDDAFNQADALLCRALELIAPCIEGALAL